MNEEGCMLDRIRVGAALVGMATLMLLCIILMFYLIVADKVSAQRPPSAPVYQTVRVQDETTARPSACPDRDPALVKCLLAGECSMINGGKYLVHHQQLIVFDAQTCWALGRVH